MIQDIEPHLFNNAYLPQPPDQNSYLLCYRKNEILVSSKNAMLQYPRFSDLSGIAGIPSSIYLFSIDGDRFYLPRQECCFAGGFVWKPLDILRAENPLSLAFAGMTGLGLARWYDTHQFCGKCGQPLKHDEKERMLFCKACAVMEYPKIAPAVIVAVTNADKLLLTKYANRPFRNYALIAGFAEIGETIEGTVRREVLEETGLCVKNIVYYKSQPWGFTDTLLFGFFCEVDGDDTIQLDEEELALAVWMPREEIPDSSQISLTSEMMMQFKSGNFPLGIESVSNTIEL